MASSSLVRYNFRVVVFSNWWLVVFPLAASQFTVFWNLTTQRPSPALPAQNVEFVFPLLGAFLSAHILSPEYHARIGAILASKPVNLRRVVLMRLLVVLALVFGLAAISLVAHYFGMGPYDIGQAAMACVPSVLFLSMLSLTFATLFRQPLAGFGVALLYWALDLPPGPPMHPYVSIRSLSSSLAAPAVGMPTFVQQWWIAKALLLAGAILLYAVHSRMVFTLGSPITRRTRVRGLGYAAALIGAYLLSGAFIKVGYGYTHRGQLPIDDATWFRTQLAPFSPLPVAALFGPAFQRYVGVLPTAWKLMTEGESDRWGDTAEHRAQLHDVLDHMNGSIWAPSAADLLARTEGTSKKVPERKIPYYDRIVHDYPGSPYVVFALRDKARALDDAGRTDEAAAIYAQIVQRADSRTCRSEALRYLAETARKKGDRQAAVSWARQWAGVAPIQERFNALILVADILRDSGDTAGAKQVAAQANEAARTYLDAARDDRVQGTGGQLALWMRQAQEAQQRSSTF